MVNFGLYLVHSLRPEVLKAYFTPTAREACDAFEAETGFKAGRYLHVERFEAETRDEAIRKIRASNPGNDDAPIVFVGCFQ